MKKCILLSTVFVVVVSLSSPNVQAAWGKSTPNQLKEVVQKAVDAVKPSLVRIHVVTPQYREGREEKYESMGSGVVITPEGHVITNHHVAGRGSRLLCIFANKEEIEAELVGADPLTDLAVIKLMPEEKRTFPIVKFGDSSNVRVGDNVLAMGSPRALSQSVTMGIVSNTEMIMPRWYGPYGRLEQDGEDVGSLVRWIGHDAQIFGGNSGGPLVDLDGNIIGINEISMGLGGAIPGNLAQDVARELIENGKVTRAWLGMQVQPMLKHSETKKGILISGTIGDSPASEAAMEPGDILINLAGRDISVRFDEELPEFNRFVSDLAIGEPINAVVLRDGNQETLEIVPAIREKRNPDQHELKQWGITCRNLSLVMAKEMKRENRDGVLVTTVRPGGPAGEAKPRLSRLDVILKVHGAPIRILDDLRKITNEISEGKTEPTPVLVEFERKSERLLTVVNVGIKKLRDPGLEVKKAWLPVETQVISRDMAKHLGDNDLKGFRITQVYAASTAEKAGLEPGDLIVAVDGEPLTASAPEHEDELRTLIRQYKVGTETELKILRGNDEKRVEVELVRAPRLNREMKKYRDDEFEFTARNITFFDKAKERWKEEQRGVLVAEIQSGGWAALGHLYVGDLIVNVDGHAIDDVDTLKASMKDVSQRKPKAIVFRVVRGIYTVYVELEPQWENVS